MGDLLAGARRMVFEQGLGRREDRAVARMLVVGTSLPPAVLEVSRSEVPRHAPGIFEAVPAHGDAVDRLEQEVGRRQAVRHGPGRAHPIAALESRESFRADSQKARASSQPMPASTLPLYAGVPGGEN